MIVLEKPIPAIVEPANSQHAEQAAQIYRAPGDLPKVNIVDAREDLARYTAVEQKNTAPAAATTLTDHNRAPEAAAKSVDQDNPSTSVITVSGAFTSRGNHIFTFVDELASNSVHIPYGFHSANHVTKQLREAIKTELEKGNKVLVIGHSVGSAVAYNVVHGEFQNKEVSGIYLDPPYRTWMAKVPLLDRLQDFSAIRHSVQSGIADDPRSIKWTDGRAFINFRTHDPFDFPHHGENPKHLDALREKILKILAPHSPEAIGPDAR